MKTAVVLGAAGQDGRIMCDLLRRNGYKVFAGARRRAGEWPEETRETERRYVDVTDGVSVAALLKEAKPHEVYNFAAQSFVPASWPQAASTVRTDAEGVANVLEAVRLVAPKARVYQASSSEMFGDEPAPQGLSSDFNPLTPYAVSKVAGHYLVKAYRRKYGIYAVSGICFNHESKFRGPEFVTQLVARGVNAIKRGKQKSLVMGSLEPKRDWGWAPDYVYGMWRSLRYPTAQDWVFGTGQSHSVQTLVTLALSAVNLDFRGRVTVDPSRQRGAWEVPSLCADPVDVRFSQRMLGWKNTKTFPQLVQHLVKEAA